MWWFSSLYLLLDAESYIFASFALVYTASTQIYGSGMHLGFELRSLQSHNQQLNTYSQVFSFTTRKLHMILRSTSLLPHSIQVCKHTDIIYMLVYVVNIDGIRD
jgi:hypothetical protein